jgi:hypothetical protein
MKYFKTTLILFSLFFNYSFSFGQSFSLSELIKMSKMDVEGFDTFVSIKGFVFSREDTEDGHKGVTYILNPDKFDKSKAEKFITLYSPFQYRFNRKLGISYSTVKKIEYLNIKNQIKNLQFQFVENKIITQPSGVSANYFLYRKGLEEISIFASNDNSYEINYKVKLE